MIKTEINDKYIELEGFIKSLPAVFNHTGKLLFDSRNSIKSFEAGKYILNAKSFMIPIFINQLIYTTFRESKAKRSYMYALKLREAGFNTPDPVAYIEQKEFLLFKRSLYISIQEDFDGNMQEFREGKIEGREDLLRQFAQFTAKLHTHKIQHIDYSSGNILYKKNSDTYTFYLVDLNRMKFDEYIDIDTACFGFRRLWGSNEMITLIVKEYAKARNMDEKTCLDKTDAYRKKFWNRFSKQHPGASAYTP